VSAVHRRQCLGEDVVVADTAQLWLHRTGRQAGRVEQVVDQGLQAVGALVGRRQLRGGIGGRQVQVGVEQAAHGRFDRSQGCAEVVPDRREQGAAQLGHLRPPLGRGRLARHPLRPNGEQRLAGHTAQH
jgi:hypothetical protein